ncbi:MAG TPA: VOC family protein [Fulvivirga sp.]|nr:VOC family protein [Fulvivirga sp.]
MQNNMVGWFELPVAKMDRAIKFYETVFEIKIERQNLEGLDMAWFPANHQGGGAMGSLVHMPKFYTPGIQGPLIYFTAHSGDLDNEIGRVEGAGGKIIQGKKLISEDIGYMGLIMDTEGNRVALHSRK